jgi:hypothetical protein
VYVDRLPPEAAVVSFEPYASAPGNPNDRDLIVRSTDQTADNMHIFLDLPAALTDQQVLAIALGGQNDAGQYDRDQWIYGFNGVSTGNHVTTVVTFEPTFDGVHGFNVQRFAGLFTDTNIGAGFGDMNGSGTFTASDIRGIGNNSVEDVLLSDNQKFHAALDLNADGSIDNRDLFLLKDSLVESEAGADVMNAYASLLVSRLDFSGNGLLDAADYTVWRDRAGWSEEYQLWKEDFGAIVGGGAGAGTLQVPEPACLPMAVTLLAGLALSRAIERRKF